MECIEIKESKILAEQQMARQRKKSKKWKKELEAQLEDAITKLTAPKKTAKSMHSSRLYRQSEALAEIELPRFSGGPPLLYAVMPDNGENITDALVMALRQLRESLLDGGLDEALLLAPAAAATLHLTTTAVRPLPAAVSST